jgi:hypothetical protein
MLYTVDRPNVLQNVTKDDNHTPLFTKITAGST